MYVPKGYFNGVALAQVLANPHCNFPPPQTVGFNNFAHLQQVKYAFEFLFDTVNGQCSYRMCYALFNAFYPVHIPHHLSLDPRITAIVIADDDFVCFYFNHCFNLRHQDPYDKTFNSWRRYPSVGQQSSSPLYIRHCLMLELDQRKFSPS